MEKSNTLTACRFILLSLLLLFPSSFMRPQSAEEVLDKMIEAQGGREALEKIKDTTLTGYVEMVQMGLGGSLKTFQKEPNKLRLDATVQGALVTQAFDGETAWMTNPMTGLVEEMPPSLSKDVERSALGNGAYLNPEQFGITYSVTGTESLDGRNYIVLAQHFQDGFTATLLVDSETFLLYKSIAPSVNEMGDEVEVETVFSNYKSIEGIEIAHTLVTYQQGKEFMKMEIDEVEFNTGLADSLFNLGRK